MTVVLIPAYEPDKELIKVVEELTASSFTVVVVNDGSGEAYADIFRQIADKTHIVTLEKNIDHASEDLPKWKSFTLPGGSRAAAIAHICRTICRRAERQILVLNETEPVEGQIICYVNRLSDYFYVLALRLNFLEGKEEILWQK